MRATLHGRDAELQEVVAAFDRVRRGSATTFALVGEPGIGKTRLAEEVATRASDAGFTVCWGRAWEAGGAPAYWPWRTLFDAMPALGSSARAGALGTLWGKGGTVATDPEQARFDMFDAVAAALRTASAAAPLLCVLDDLHAADAPSLELTAFVTRHLRAQPILWILTWRDVEAGQAAGRDLIAAISREARTLALRRLTAGETRGVVDELSAGLAMEQAANAEGALFEATAGNPLFIIETLACLTTRGRSRLPREIDQLPVTQGVAAVVRSRAASLSPAAQRALETASLVGREVSLDRWAEAADAPEDLLRRRATEIVASGLLVEGGHELRGACWTFSHDLVREAIYRSVPDDLARAAHRRVALALDRRICAGELALAGERLHHALAAVGAIEAPVVLRWAIEASEHSRAQCAYEEALATLRRAIAALGPLASDPRLQLALGRAHLDVGDVGAARAALHMAIDATRSSTDARTFAQAVLALGSRYVLGDIHDDLVTMIDQALASLGPDERDLRARLIARKAAALTPAREPAHVLAMARSAVELVSGSTDEVAQLEVCVGVGSAFADFAHPHERIAVNQDLVRLARKHGDRALELRGLSRLVTDHIEAGDFRRADMVLRERDDLARALKQPRFGWMGPLFRSMRAMANGELDTCSSAVAEAEARGLESTDANATRCVAVHRAWLSFVCDDVAAMLAHERRVLEALRSMPPLVSSVVRALVRYRANDVAAARAEIDSVQSLLTSGAVNTMATAAEVVAEVGPPEAARALLKRLAPHADTFAIWGLFGLTCGLPIAATLGSLEAAYGDPARATSYFENALERTTGAGTRALRVWTRYLYGRASIMHLGRPQDGAVHLEAAAREGATLGMGRLPDRCREALAKLGAVSRAARPPVSPERADPDAAIDWMMVEEGSSWRIERAGRSMLVPALRGMPMIARLVSAPDTEIHSLELVSGEAVSARDAGDAGEVLDEQARAAYRTRMSELAELIEEATERGDADRADTARSELDALRSELARAVGLGGRPRRTGAAGERARISAQRRIREAIRKIRDVDPEVADHLDRTIQTGVFCMYAPRRKRL